MIGAEDLPPLLVAGAEDTPRPEEDSITQRQATTHDPNTLRVSNFFLRLKTRKRLKPFGSDILIFLFTQAEGPIVTPVEEEEATIPTVTNEAVE